MRKTLFPLLGASLFGGVISAVAVVFFLSTYGMNNEETASPVYYNQEPAKSSDQSTNAQTVSNHSFSIASAPENFRKASSQSMAGVVHISTIEQQPLTLFDLHYGRQAQVREGTGSGVIYSSDGYIVTNNHVVEGAQGISVSLNDNRRFSASLVGTYPAADLAVLKIDGTQLPALKFADSDDSEVGDWVLAVGNPYNLSSTVTAGIISAKGRDINIINNRNAIESFIQTDAAINPGNSGGALVSTEGEVIGINTAIYSRSGGYSGYGFAIPANLVSRIADEIIESGSFRQLVLGISASELDEEYAAELGISGYTQGVVIEEVDPEGLAAQSGLQAFDLILEVAGRDVKSIPQFREAMSSRRRGERVPVAVLRDGRREVLMFQL
jgi:S1-C subfamily serine protease